MKDKKDTVKNSPEVLAISGKIKKSLRNLKGIGTPKEMIKEFLVTSLSEISEGRPDVSESLKADTKEVVSELADEWLDEIWKEEILN